MWLPLLLAAAVLLVRDPTGKWAGDPLQPWFESLRSKAGLYCCSKADGHPLDDGEWDMKGDSYRVIIQGKWTIVPNDAVISGPNKFGKAIVWLRDQETLLYYEGATTSSRIICFIPGSGV